MTTILKHGGGILINRLAESAIPAELNHEWLISECPHVVHTSTQTKGLTENHHTAHCSANKLPAPALTLQNSTIGIEVPC